MKSLSFPGRYFMVILFYGPFKILNIPSHWVSKILTFVSFFVQPSPSLSIYFSVLTSVTSISHPPQPTLFSLLLPSLSVFTASSPPPSSLPPPRLQWRRSKLGLGVSRQQHPGWVWDSSYGVCSPHLSDREPRLLPEGSTHKSDIISDVLVCVWLCLCLHTCQSYIYHCL